MGIHWSTFCKIIHVSAQKKKKNPKKKEPTKAPSISKSRLREQVVSLCNDWIEKSLTCKPPKTKVSKFQYRIRKVVDDAIWHYDGAKKCGQVAPTQMTYGRKRRQIETYSSDYYDYRDGSERNENIKIKKSLRKFCRFFLLTFKNKPMTLKTGLFFNFI